MGRPTKRAAQIALLLKSGKAPRTKAARAPTGAQAQRRRRREGYFRIPPFEACALAVLLFTNTAKPPPPRSVVTRAQSSRCLLFNGTQIRNASNGLIAIATQYNIMGTSI
ncbi:hypothetical protein EVAR_55704_1 [Eumeta japonica]|uniref:Uncharacterized protein n=1 Tax=Eumeta variegata TaxID=151549 RepID=A0A4C1ZF42_EUMVA|nr:hypothetical protein EVAR_55704_1 [Eumeta japonica]